MYKRTPDNKKLATALNDCIERLIIEPDKPVTRYLRDTYGYTSIPLPLLKKWAEEECEFTEESANDARSEIKNYQKEQGRKRKEEENRQKAAIADMPLPLAKKDGKGLEQYNPCELIAELRSRGYTGTLYFTQVKTINV